MVFRDPLAASDPAAPGGMIVEGPVPGAGRVRVGFRAGEGGQPAARFDGGAPLTGGGFASLTGLFGPGGVLELPMTLNAPYSAGFADRAGHGLWYWVPGDDRPDAGFSLVNRDGVVLVKPGPLPAPTGLVQGGGLLFPTIRDVVLLRPDGSETVLVREALNLEGFAALADGSVCGHRPAWGVSFETTVECFAPDGTARQTDLGQNIGFPSGPDTWHPVPDGALYAHSGDTTYRLVVATMAVDPVGEGALEDAVYDPSGRLFGRVGGTWSELTADSITPLDLAGYGERTTTLHAGGRFWILELDDGSVVRLPR